MIALFWKISFFPYFKSTTEKRNSFNNNLLCNLSERKGRQKGKRETSKNYFDLV